MSKDHGCVAVQRTTSDTGQREVLEFAYDMPVSTQGVDIYEAFNPGAVPSAEKEGVTR